MNRTSKRVIQPDQVPLRRRAMTAATALGAALAALVLGACPASETTPDGGGGTVEATFTSLYGDYLGECKQCHSPAGPGRTSDIEKTLDFTSRTTALATLKMTASGLVGNHTGCNGVPFLATMPAASLVVAVLDQPTRQAYDRSQFPDCDVDSISDETVKVGSQPSAAFITALKTWISGGALDN
jgi:hypothetical protein